MYRKYGAHVYRKYGAHAKGRVASLIAKATFLMCDMSLTSCTVPCTSCKETESTKKRREDICLGYMHVQSSLRKCK